MHMQLEPDETRYRSRKLLCFHQFYLFHDALVEKKRTLLRTLLVVRKRNYKKKTILRQRWLTITVSFYLVPYTIKFCNKSNAKWLFEITFF